MFVRVEDLPQKAVEMGLMAEIIKAETEARLRGEGISVPNYSYEDPYLDISVNVVNMSFSVEASLRESVVLKRDKSINCRAATWLNSVTGVHSNNPNYIVAGLQALLDSFFHDYDQANPKKKRREKEQIPPYVALCHKKCLTRVIPIICASGGMPRVWGPTSRISS